MSDRPSNHRIELSKDLGEIRILQDDRSTPVTPASRISLEAIARNSHLLQGVGIDWGSGTGCLAIAAARIEAVELVVGLEIDETNLPTAEQNVALNGSQGKVCLLWADSFSPQTDAGRVKLDSYRKRIDFVLANPPASDEGDGFEVRRRVLREFLKPGGVLFLSVSCQYGQQRVERLRIDAPGFTYHGVLASTDWVPFDLSRPDLLQCLRLYAKEEERGGLAYAFCHPSSADRKMISARDALALYENAREPDGASPLSKWQTHLFRFVGDRAAC